MHLFKYLLEWKVFQSRIINKNERHVICPVLYIRKSEFNQMVYSVSTQLQYISLIYYTIQYNIEYMSLIYYTILYNIIYSTLI